MKATDFPSRERVLAVVGATASGKTSLAIALAQHLGGEILSFDSMQVYRGMDIGTATPTADELAAVPHHFINILDPWEPYSCADFVAMARERITALRARGVLPVLCGGTGLYLDGLLRGGSFESSAPGNPAIRERLTAISEQPDGKALLWQRLQQIDPESAAATPPNNVKRVIRALEIYESCGRTKTELDRESRTADTLCYDATVLGLRYHDRSLLYSRIDKRVDLMLQEGLFEEVERLHRQGLFERSPTAAQAIGYKELLGVLHGTCSMDDAVAALKLATRHYAKRQLTWFTARPYVQWIDADTPDGALRPLSDVLNDALRCVTEGNV